MELEDLFSPSQVQCFQRFLSSEQDELRAEYWSTALEHLALLWGEDGTFWQQAAYGAGLLSRRSEPLEELELILLQTALPLRVIRSILVVQSSQHSALVPRQNHEFLLLWLQAIDPVLQHESCYHRGAMRSPPDSEKAFYRDYAPFLDVEYCRKLWQDLAQLNYGKAPQDFARCLALVWQPHAYSKESG